MIIFLNHHPLKKTSFEENENTEPEVSQENTFSDEAQDEITEEIIEEVPEETKPQPTYVEPMTPPEKFEEVKNFAQNFSYGQIQGGGNPPFSIIIRNLKYTEDKEDIITILSDFALVTEQNWKKRKKH